MMFEIDYRHKSTLNAASGTSPASDFPPFVENRMNESDETETSDEERGLRHTLRGQLSPVILLHTPVIYTVIIRLADPREVG